MTKRHNARSLGFSLLQIIRLLLQALSFFIAAKIFPTSVFADLAVIYSVAGITLPIVFLGLDYKVFVLVSEEKFTPVHFKIYLRTVTLLSLMIIGGATLYSRELINVNLFSLILFYLLEIVLNSSYNMFSLLYLTRKSHFSSVLVSAILPISRLLAMFFTVLLVEKGNLLNYLIAIQYFVIFPPTIIILYTIRKKFRANIFSLNSKAISVKSYDGLSYFATVFFRTVQNDADKVFLPRFATDLAFINYLIMARISQVFYLFMTSLFSYWSPFLLSPEVVLSKKLSAIGSLRAKFTLISIFVCVLGFLTTNLSVPFMFPDYDSGLRYSQYFFVLLFFSSMTFFNLESLTILGVNRERAVLQSITGGIQLIGLTLLVLIKEFTIMNILHFSLGNYMFTFVLSSLLVRRSIILKKGI